MNFHLSWFHHVPDLLIFDLRFSRDRLKAAQFVLTFSRQALNKNEGGSIWISTQPFTDCDTWTRKKSCRRLFLYHHGKLQMILLCSERNQSSPFRWGKKCFLFWLRNEWIWCLCWERFLLFRNVRKKYDAIDVLKELNFYILSSGNFCRSKNFSSSFYRKYKN